MKIDRYVSGVFFLLFALLSGPVNANRNATADSICAYIQVDNKTKFRAFFKLKRLKIRNVFKGISCQGENMLAYSQRSNAVDIGTYIIGRLPKKMLSSYVEHLTTGSTLATAANARLNK
jgi:hypothetical protein